MQESQGAVEYITIGDRSLRVWQFPDGSLRLSLAEVAGCIGTSETRFRQFIAERADQQSIESAHSQDGEELAATRLATLFWVSEAALGNSQARDLVVSTVELPIKSQLQGRAKSSPPTSLDDAIDYVLQKNHELYERLS
ncbi:MAG: hypothetical protein ACFB9N_06850 [Geitlerinemataceae cyanobacterium]